MKLNIVDMQDFFKTTTSAENITRDDDNNVISFDYIKKYQNGSTRTIKVSTYKERKKREVYEYLEEKDFFELLVSNIKEVENIKLSGDKIIKFTLHGKKYKTDKLEFPKLFDFLEFQSFYKIVKDRFYSNDEMLRSGYFSGLIGTYDKGLREYKANQEQYDLFDVDFNSAYPFCFKYPLPFGRFYDEEEWDLVKEKYASFTNFYEIKLKTLKNSFGVFIPVQPYVEYMDFDFLLSCEKSSMIVSADRLALINKVYGADAYVLRKTYFCATKKHTKFSKFASKMYDLLRVEKENGEAEKVKAIKIALNSLVGRFGKRDEAKNIDSLSLISNKFESDIIRIDWSSERKENLNYLPIAMAINDMTALRLFNLLTNEKCIRICYNTDGGIVAVKKDTTIINSKKIGMLKTKKIEKPLFFSSTFLYNRPLVYDFLNDKIYNSNSVFYDENSSDFFYSETCSINCRKGFLNVENTYPLAVSKYNGFNFRKSEILAKVGNTDLYKKLQTVKAEDFEYNIFRLVADELEKLCNPFDELYNIKIKKEPEVVVEYEQICIDESFFK